MNDRTVPSPRWILGYSGLHDSITQRHRAMPELSVIEARLAQGADSAAALLCDGEVIAAAEEERFTGEKHTGQFPVNAMRWCLEEAGIDIDQVSTIAHGFNHGYCRPFYEKGEAGVARYQQILDPSLQMEHVRRHFGEAASARFVAVRHHDAHAASAFYPSGFDEALVLVVDGMGEVQSLSVYRGSGGNLELLGDQGVASSIGIFYAVITQHLGFEPNSDEYKVMGLAPYGNADRFRPVLDQCVQFRDAGEILVPAFFHDRSPLERQSHRGVRAWLAANAIPERHPDQPLTQDHKDLAAGIQDVLNRAMLHIIGHWVRETGMRKICLAGGVALNCTANGIIQRSGLVDEVFVQPAAADDGTAIGAALWHYHLEVPEGRRSRQLLPLFGSQADSAEIEAEIARLPAGVSVSRPADERELVEATADLLLQGHVVAWMQGRMEFGPRALGNRSILADPRDPEMRDRVNALVKLREGFRPFAPAALADRAAEIFDIDEEAVYPYMLFTVPVRQQYRERLPAITHIDGSARLQTVDRNQHPRFWALISAFGKKSGIPVLLNTSFNIKGQPIVRTAREAVDTFLGTGITTLVLHDRILVKSGEG